MKFCRHRKLAAALARSAPPVDEAAQALKQAGNAMHLVQDHQFVLMIRQVELGIRQSAAIRCRFQIEIERRALSPDLQRQRRLSDLTGSQQSHGRVFAQERRQLGLDSTGDHPCNYGLQFHKYRVKRALSSWRTPAPSSAIRGGMHDHPLRLIESTTFIRPKFPAYSAHAYPHVDLQTA